MIWRLKDCASLWFLSWFCFFQHNPGFSLDHFNISDAPIRGFLNHRWYTSLGIKRPHLNHLKSLILGVMKLAPKWRVFFAPSFWRCQCVLILFFFDGYIEGFRDSGSFTKNNFPKTAKWFRLDLLSWCYQNPNMSPFPPSSIHHWSIIHPSPSEASEEARSSSTISKQSVMPFTWCCCSVEFGHFLEPRFRVWGLASGHHSGVGRGIKKSIAGSIYCRCIFSETASPRMKWPTKGSDWCWSKIRKTRIVEYQNLDHTAMKICSNCVGDVIFCIFTSTNPHSHPKQKKHPVFVGNYIHNLIVCESPSWFDERVWPFSYWPFELHWCDTN